MFKKIIMAGAMLALFACSSIDEESKSSTSSQGGGNNSSDSSQGGGDDGSTSSDSSQGGGGDGSTSSSSVPSGPSIVSKVIASNGEQPSEIFRTFYYTFTLKAGSDEDLKQFWSCSAEKQDTKPASTCQSNDMTGAILQHNLTNQHSPLHYDRLTTRIYIDGSASMWKGITLNQWNLTENKDEAALGLNVSEKETDNIGDAKITDLDKVVSFEYKYAGGAHELRLSSTDADFWYYEIKEATPVDVSAPSSIEYTTVTIPVKDLKGMGSFAASGGKEGTPFDISKVSKFLWAVKYKADSENNKGSLVLYDFRANVEQ